MKIIYSSMLPLLAAVCVWTSGCGSLESAVESSTTTATTATETTTETTVAETTTTSATETTTASATEIATEIAAIPTTEATDDAASIEVFACTAGTWYMDGDPDTASLVMDGEGGVAAYYATGNLEYSGYLECTDATSGTYAIYQDSGEYVTDFTFDDADTFHINSNWGPVTFRRT
ncbi:hypothetical protein [Ruminococcus callidus]|uniref:hypothetical protein n=1 Tax=Ruminococcus callidus TaxID=40519 RepID=UPI0023F8ADBF|nr:hypothetical protein [Ruminococcus callidus]